MLVMTGEPRLRCFPTAKVQLFPQTTKSFLLKSVKIKKFFSLMFFNNFSLAGSKLFATFALDKRKQ